MILNRTGSLNIFAIAYSRKIGPVCVLKNQLTNWRNVLNEVWYYMKTWPAKEEEGEWKLEKNGGYNMTRWNKKSCCGGLWRKEHWFKIWKRQRLRINFPLKVALDWVLDSKKSRLRDPNWYNSKDGSYEEKISAKITEEVCAWTKISRWSQAMYLVFAFRLKITTKSKFMTVFI